MRLICTFFILLLTFSTFAQQRYTISGYVKDVSTGEELIGVNIFIPDQQAGTTTNAYGFYSLTVPAGIYEIKFSYLGYEEMNKQVDLNSDLTLNMELVVNSTELNEVEVTDKSSSDQIRSVEMSVATLNNREIQKIPQLLGETDIIRTLTLLPGITTVGEGSNGFNVRGGAADQNLILLDEAPVYNSSHLFGFFSIFNADAVKDVKLYKGGIPANYGGRLSSVVDVRQKEGNMKRFGFNGGLGLLSSRLLIESPIKKDKASFMLAGRRSYLDLFLKLSSDPEINSNTLYFYDLNTKINWKINEKNRLYLSSYFGRDVFGLADLFGFGWGNITASLRWNHLYHDKLFSNLSLVYSDYSYQLGTPDDEEFAFELQSRIRNYHLRNSYIYYIDPESTLDLGVEMTAYVFSPGKFTGFQNIELQKEYAFEPAIYASLEKEFSPRWTLQMGLRYSSFYKLGSMKSRDYLNPEYPRENEVTGSTNYDNLELIKAFHGLDGLEPRVSVNHRITENTSIKASINRIRQYIHLISNTTSPTPVDLYRSAGRYIDPSTVYQYALGFFQNLDQDKYEFSLELYYKSFEDLVDYRNGAQLIFQENIETELLSGIGRAYGAELLLRKNTGRLTGWIGYTFSRSERKVESDDPARTISEGEWYPANYDKTHDVSLVANYEITKKWEAGFIFIFQSGRPITPPSGKFEHENITIPIYTHRNSYRIPAYHRLDLTATYTPARKEGQRFYSSWSFGVYNLYGRRNAYSIFFRPQSSNPDMELSATASRFRTEAVRLSIFATAIPFVTWNFNF